MQAAVLPIFVVYRSELFGVMRWTECQWILTLSLRYATCLRSTLFAASDLFFCPSAYYYYYNYYLGLYNIYY